jgi:predicted nucleic acid-binding protein
VLTTIPDGVVCYLDATIFYYHLVDAPPLSDDCSDLLLRIAQDRVQGVTSSVAIAEATHKVMLAEVVQRHGVDHRGLIARLKRHPALLDGLTNHQRVAATVRSLGLPVEPITLALLARGAALSAQKRLLTNDALTLAVMEKLGVTTLATNDDDFDAVDGITVCKPTRAAPPPAAMDTCPSGDSAQ